MCEALDNCGFDGDVGVISLRVMFGVIQTRPPDNIVNSSEEGIFFGQAETDRAYLS